MARIEVASEFTTLAQDISSTTLVVSQYEFSFWIISRDQEEYILKIYYKNKLKKKKKISCHKNLDLAKGRVNQVWVENKSS